MQPSITFIFMARATSIHRNDSRTPPDFVEFDVDSVVGVHEFWNHCDIGARFVGDDRQVYLAAHIACLFHHVRRHGLLHIHHALRFQPVDLADGLFLVGPSLVDIHANGLIGHAAHGFDGRLVGLQPHLDFQNRKIRCLARLLAGDLRRVNADGKIRNRRIRGVQPEKMYRAAH